jgi:hypothetical protein
LFVGGKDDELQECSSLSTAMHGRVYKLPIHLSSRTIPVLSDFQIVDGED